MTDYERRSLETLVAEGLKEYRRYRRWKTFFRFIYVLVIVLVAVGAFNVFSHNHAQHDANQPHAAIIHINGTISSDSFVNAQDVIDSLGTAFRNKRTKGIILAVNSPGGSPVESALIFDEVRRLRTKYPNKPVYAVCGDICASGGYFIAVSAKEIYANRMSLVGSIGVRLDSFGFVDALQKLGITRRLYTAGTNKALLDPFSPVNAKSEQHIRQLLSVTHAAFIDSVKQGRGKRLQANPEIFSGLFWTGEQAKSLGLIDGFSSVNTIARDTLHVEITVDYTHHPSLLDSIAAQTKVTMSQAIQHLFTVIVG